MATTENGIYYPDDYSKSADIPGDLKKLAESVNEAISIKYKTLTLSVDNWTENEETGYYEYDVADEDVTSNYIVDVYMDIVNQNLLAVGYTDTYDGGFKVITDTVPTEDVTINVSFIPVTAS